jgi:hypothetical protein
MRGCNEEKLFNIISGAADKLSVVRSGGIADKSAG